MPGGRSTATSFSLRIKRIKVFSLCFIKVSIIETMKEQAYYRLIALWVLFEAMLGGIIHGLRIPVSGLVVGSAAVICISLIGYYVGQRGAILKATLIVAIFKMML